MIPINFQVTCSKVKVKLLFWAQCVVHFIYFNPLVTCFLQVLLLQRRWTWILYHGRHRCFWNISCFNNILLYIPRHRSNKLSVYYSNDDQGRVYQNCKFHISHYSEYALSSSLSVYFTLIAIVLKDYNAAFYTIVDFYSL